MPIDFTSTQNNNQKSMSNGYFAKEEHLYLHACCTNQTTKFLLCMLISFLALLVLSLCPKLHTPVLDILALAGSHPTVSNFPCIKPTSGPFSPSACSSWKTIIGTVTSPWCIPTKSFSSLFATLRLIFPDL